MGEEEQEGVRRPTAKAGEGQGARTRGRKVQEEVHGKEEEEAVKEHVPSAYELLREGNLERNAAYLSDLGI